MARIRSIKPTFWQSGSNGKLTRDARLLFIGLWNEADDDGRLIGSIVSIAGNLFPHDKDVTLKKVERWLGELIAQDKVVRYEVDDVPYLWMPHFTTHQKISHPTPSVLPPAPGVIREGFRNGSGASPETFVPDKEEDKEREGSADEEREGKRPTLCPDPFVVDDLLRNWGRTSAPNVDLDALAQRMVLWSRGNAKRKVSWRRTLQSWALAEQEKHAAKPPKINYDAL